MKTISNALYESIKFVLQCRQSLYDEHNEPYNDDIVIALLEAMEKEEDERENEF